MNKYEINTPERIRHFLSQTASESNQGRSKIEEGEDEYLAGLYSDRKEDLGNEGSEDALKYRGAGYIQLTGKYNYQKFAEAMGDPRILEEGYSYVAAKYPAEASAFWWSDNNINRLVDNIKGRNSHRQVVLITARVNGFDADGNIPDSAHIEKRIQYYRKLEEFEF